MECPDSPQYMEHVHNLQPVLRNLDTRPSQKKRSRNDASTSTSDLHPQEEETTQERRVKPRSLSLSAPDACDASMKDITGDSTDEQAQKKSKTSTTSEAHESNAASKDKNTNTATQSKENLSCNHGGNCFFIIEADSISEESLEKPEDNYYPAQTSSHREDAPKTETKTNIEDKKPEAGDTRSSSSREKPVIESLTVPATEVEEQQPGHQNAPSSHREDAPKTETKTNIEDKKPEAGDTRSSSSREKPVIESLTVPATEVEEQQPGHQNAPSSHREDAPKTETKTNVEDKKPKAGDTHSSSSREEPVSESLTVPATEIEEQQPGHQNAPSSHREDAPTESSTVMPADLAQNQPLEEPAHVSVEALPDAPERHQSVDEDVWQSIREGIAAEPSTAMMIDAEEEQAGHEETCPGHREYRHLEPPMFMAPNVEQQPGHQNAPSSHREDAPTESSTVMPADLAQNRPVEEPAHVSVEALPDAPERHQSVDEDVWQSIREGIAAEPSTAMMIDAEEEQAGHEETCPGHREYRHLEPPMFMAPNVEQQPGHQNAPSSHREDAPTESSTVMPADLAQNRPVEEPAHVSVEALPDAPERHQSVDEDVWQSIREGIAAEPSTAMMIDAEEEQAGHEETCPGRREYRHLEPPMFMAPNVEQQPGHDYDQTSLLIEELSRLFSTPGALPTEEGQHRPLHAAPPVRFMHLHEYEAAHPSDSDDELPDYDDPDEAEFATPEPDTSEHAQGPAAAEAGTLVHDSPMSMVGDDLHGHFEAEFDVDISVHDSPLSNEGRDHVAAVFAAMWAAAEAELSTPEPGSPEYVPGEAEAEFSTPEPGSPEYVPGEAEAEFSTPEPGSPEYVPGEAEAEFSTPEPGSPEYVPGEAEAEFSTPDPAGRYSDHHHYPEPVSQEDTQYEAEYVSPDPAGKHSDHQRHDAHVPESHEAVPADVDNVTQLHQLHQLSTSENPAPELPENMTDEAQPGLVTPMACRPSSHIDDPLPEAPEAVQIRVETLFVNPLYRNSPSSHIHGPASETPEAIQTSDAMQTEDEAQPGFVTPMACSPSSHIDDRLPEAYKAMQIEAETGFVNPFHRNSPSSCIHDPASEPSEAMQKSYGMQSEDGAQPGFDTPVKRRLGSPVDNSVPEWPESMSDEAYQTMLGKRPVHETADDLPLDADRRSPAHGHSHPSMRTTCPQGSSSSFRPPGRNAPVNPLGPSTSGANAPRDPMAPSGSGEQPDVEIINPLPSYWTGKQASGHVSHDDDMMSNLAAFSMCQEDGQEDPEEFIRQQSLLLDAYSNARDLKDLQPAEHPPQMTQPNIPQQPVDNSVPEWPEDMSDEAQPGFVTPVKRRLGSPVDNSVPEWPESMPDEAQPGFVTPVKRRLGSPVDNSVPEWPEDMSDEAQPGFVTPVKRRLGSRIHGPASEWPESMPDEAQPGFVTPVKHSPSSPVDNSVPEWPEDMSDEAQPGFDTPVKRRPASHIHSPASE